MRTVHVRGSWREPWLNHPHNIVLDWWTRLGLPGLLLGIAWLAAGVAGIVAALRRRQDGALMVGLLAGAAAALAHGLIDMSYALPDLMLVKTDIRIAHAGNLPADF